MSIQTFIMLSACHNQNSEGENAKATAKLANRLERLDLDFTRTRGVYNGSAEDSFLVSIKGEDYSKALMFFKGLAREYLQESILEISQSEKGTHAWLHFVARSLDETYIGEFKRLAIDETADSYTLMPATGARFTFELNNK